MLNDELLKIPEKFDDDKRVNYEKSLVEIHKVLN